MAKQNKGRKFFAASATAALVAAAIVPAASAATSTIKDFDKVAPYAKEAVQALVDAGVITGDEKGNFNPTNSITRAEAAKIFTGALELEAEGDVDFKDVKKDAWYYDSIAATVEYGIFEGVSATEFAPNKNLTRSEAAKILVEAFELEGEADLKDFADASTVKPWAKSYLEIAVANGVIKGSEVNGKTNLNPNASITRQEFAVVFDRTLELVDATPTVDKIEVVDAKTLNVTLSDGTKETITLEKALEPNKETEVTFTINDVEYKEKVTFVVTTATAVKSVSATNLKQVVVEFDGKVDPATASEEGNYALTGSGSPEVDSVIVAEDGRSVTLNVVDKLENQVEYKLAVNNIKAGDKVINAKDLKFKPLDNTVPTVSKVEALGNKTIRVHFSEPVKPAQTSQFKIDGKTVAGNIQTNLNTVIIKLSSALTDGEHTLTTEGTQDYNNFKTVQADTKFNVVEDKTAPTVTSVVSASFEKVVLKFSEPVEQVFASNIYWMQGGTKKQASSVKQLTDDTFEFTFAGTNKLVYTTDLYVTNVKDYSGNVIDKDTKVQVTPVVDQTRPEVISANINKDNSKQIVIKFTKTLDDKTATKAANYVIKDKDGKVQPISNTVTVKDKKEVTITVLTPLKDNADYTLSVTGVADDTTLTNVMLPYTTTLTIKDVTAPELTKVVRLNDKQLYVQFNEAMATSGDGSVVEAEKYTIKDKSDNNKALKPTSFDITADSKGVILGFNDKLPDANKIDFTVQLVKDLAGNYLDGYKASPAEVKDQVATKITNVTAVETKKVEVEFDNAIQSLNQNDFTISGGYGISYAELSTDGKTATFTLKDELPEDLKKESLKLEVAQKPNTVDILGEKLAEKIQPTKIYDEIKPTVKGDIVAADTTGKKIKITFNEDVKITPTEHVVSDFVVKENTGSETKNVTVKSVTPGDNASEIIVTLENPVVAATISAKDVRFVTDLAEKANTIKDIAETAVELGGADTVAPTVTGQALSTDKTTYTFTFSEKINNATANETALKAAVKFAVDGTTFAALEDADTVTISGNTLEVKFATALTGKVSKIQIAAAALKDESDNKTVEINSNAIVAE
ncbi:S-layer homology domain-containing protein [Lysinibacillus agricola]|uniref:S-layer homology domain-containing protein n=1 Tax=Lysinibacillus agricola TaxID=2590012 RepID=A0ABX7AVA3_9BACI|nr:MULTISPECIES: S-layer homology domain-containing protein [Lysinibacillus]QQP13202.1 S-layer homology domain-containing protein [Lysinibacillus agricola]